MSNDTSLARGFRLQGNERVYTIEEKLGQGGFGITYRVRGPVKVGNIRMTVDFALKEFFLRDDCERLDNSSVSYSNPARDRVENSRKDFVNEALRLKKIGFSHPNIVSFDEVFEANNTAYYVMEYLRGKSLGDYVTEKGQLSEEETLSLLKPVMEAVEMLHQNRVCHLDIKPDNIMLEPTDDGSVRPVLIDFGLSKHYDKEGHATSTINSFGYSEGYAPTEQYGGITTFSPGADVYALGATLFYCLTGKTPPRALDLRPGEMAGMLPETVSDRLREVIRRMTLDKHDRPSSLSGLLDASTSTDTVRVETISDNSTKNFVKSVAEADNPAEKEEKPAKPVKPVKVEKVEVQPAQAKSKKTLLYLIGGIVVAAVVAVVIILSGQKKDDEIKYNEETPAADTTAVEPVVLPEEEEPVETPAVTAEPQTAPKVTSQQPSARKQNSYTTHRQGSSANSTQTRNKPNTQKPNPQKPNPQKPNPHETETQHNPISNPSRPQKVTDF